MATSAYLSWLKKREFKTPRTPSSPPPSIPTSTIPPVSKKRPRSWVSSRGEAAGRQDGTKVAARQPTGTKVAELEEAQDAQAQVASRQDAAPKRPWGWKCSEEDVDVVQKRRRSTQEHAMKETSIKLVNASKALGLSAAKRDMQVAAWSGSVHGDAKVAARVTAEVAAGTSQEKEVEKRKRAVDQMDESGDATTKRLRFSLDDRDSDGGGNKGGLPPKSAVQQKPRRMPMAMLDESQYWMAVDRFSHLT
ncbi:unnamed protein product [Phytophthora fragariaefolia]|uniref:Unnamed protein product n=1 Tax=Phytophthora fragariaefolia TaxID=1490495 RepID=A0A9W6YDM0_9STRA|nr:unnamed protein product [Phytophthora fragariaefolia]